MYTICTIWKKGSTMISILVISKNLTKAAIFSLTKYILLCSEADFSWVTFTANFGEQYKQKLNNR